MGTRSPLPVDVLVGQNIQILRIQRGLSQTELGRQVGLTYQQIQKYERGNNRLGASRLSHVAEVLRVPIVTLFDGRPSTDRPTRVDAPGMLLLRPHAIRLLMIFAQIQSRRVRTAILDLVEAIGGSEPTRHQSWRRRKRVTGPRSKRG
jgi:transcriptional regulator with XRE-family HTH domain